MLDSISALSNRCRYFFEGAYARVTNCYDRRFYPDASTFYSALNSGGFAPDAHIDILPRHRLIYVCVPKCASTTIKMTLSSLARRTIISSEQLHKRRYSGLYSPARTGMARLYRLAVSPETLRFSFVRNPYSRLVSAWADKFQNKPLVWGDSFINSYLSRRYSIDAVLPEGSDCTLSFDQFVKFAAATANHRLDAHWHLQDDLLNMPGIKLDLIGKVESFDEDFARVLDHVGAGDRVRQASHIYLNSSQHRPWRDYYSSRLADIVYRAYERDFDRFEYARDIPTR